jgi:transposase
MAETVNIRMDQLQSLTERLNKQKIIEEDYPLLELLVGIVVSLNMELVKKNVTIARLRKLFAIKSEKSKDILTAADTRDGDKISISKEQKGSDSSGDISEKTKKGHGRNGKDAYKNADKEFIPHQSCKRGDQCSKCMKGKLYPVSDGGMFVHIIAQAPYQATVYELEKFRCNLCGELFTASPPTHTNNMKYDESVTAMTAVLKYGAGFPFYRIDSLQDNLGVPLPSSTQWELIEAGATALMPVYRNLACLAAQGKVIHNDDTNMKVLSLMKENKMNPGRKRKGIFTSGFISRTDSWDIALYYTGRKTAGENLRELLEYRDNESAPPIQMCDASSRNEQDDVDVLLANCLTHGRRKFVDLIEYFPPECSYMIKAFRQIYRNDKITRVNKMTDLERLNYHQEHSEPVMKEMYAWLNRQIAEKKVEPNSDLGIAFKYMIRHWQPLTLFLRQPGAPLDNNIAERALKKAILHRKNSLFFKTENGAAVGDCYMSIIHTCELNHVNPFHYLTSLLKNQARANASPQLWRPWNYLDQLPVRPGRAF